MPHMKLIGGLLNASFNISKALQTVALEFFQVAVLISVFFMPIGLETSLIKFHHKFYISFLGLTQVSRSSKKNVPLPTRPWKQSTMLLLVLLMRLVG